MHQRVARPADAVDQKPAFDVLATCAAEKGEGTIEPGNIISLPRVLARIPDLDAVESRSASEPLPASPSGRLLSQALSTKLLLGGTVLLVLAAVVPLRMSGRSVATPADEKLPGWQPVAATSPADKTGGQAAQLSKIPSGGPNDSLPRTGPNADQLSGTTKGPSRVTSPQVPGRDNAVPLPGWNAPPADAAAAARGQAPLQPDPIRSRPAENRLHATAPAESKAMGVPEIGNAPDPYRGRYEAERPRPGYYRQQQPEASPNQPMGIGEPLPAVPPGYGASRDPQPDTRLGDQSGARVDFRRHNGAYRQPQDENRYPLGLADRRMMPPASAGNEAGSLPPGEPGVARFEGTIAKPPVRTEYERARPGVF